MTGSMVFLVKRNGFFPVFFGNVEPFHIKLKIIQPVPEHPEIKVHGFRERLAGRVNVCALVRFDIEQVL